MRQRTVASMLAFLVASLSAAAASAGGEPTPGRPAFPAIAAPPVDQAEPVSEVEWYGGRLLLADALSIGAVVVGARADASPLVAVGLISMFATAPALHATQGNGGRTLISLGLRVGGPLAGAFIAGWVHDRRRTGGPECDCMGGAVAVVGGAAFGLLGAMLIDDIFLPFKTVKRPSHDVALAPAVLVGPHGGSVGLAGRF